MNLKYIMLNETNQTQKAKFRMVLFMWHFGKGNATGTESQSVIAGSWE